MPRNWMLVLNLKRFRFCERIEERFVFSTEECYLVAYLPTIDSNQCIFNRSFERVNILIVLHLTSKWLISIVPQGVYKKKSIVLSDMFNNIIPVVLLNIHQSKNNTYYTQMRLSHLTIEILLKKDWTILCLSN